VTLPRLAVVTPAIDVGAIDVASALAGLGSPRLAIDHHFLEDGPSSIDDQRDIDACRTGLLAVARRLRGGNCAGLVVNCMYDPCLDDLREMLQVPVFGCAQTSMAVAASLGRPFGIVDVLDLSDPAALERGRAMMMSLLTRYGVASACISYRAIDVPILDLYASRPQTLAALERAASAMAADGAASILLGCTGLAGLSDDLREACARLHLPVTVIEPLRTTVGIACAMR
jgi:allantoin racemase